MKKYSDFRKSPAKQLHNFINTIDFKEVYNMIQKLQTPPNLVLKTKHSTKDKRISQNIILKAQIGEICEKDDTTNVDSEVPSESMNSFEAQQIENLGRKQHRRHNTESCILTNNSEQFGSVDDFGNLELQKDEKLFGLTEKEKQEQKNNQKWKLIERLYLLQQKINQAKISQSQIKLLSSKIENMEKLLSKK